jgi:hypothetical protein
MSQPHIPHLIVAKRILRYIKGSLDQWSVFGIAVAVVVVL